MGSTANWNTMGNCRAGDPDRLFVAGAAQRTARSVCRGCPVLKQCLAMALTEKVEYGVWGGMTERERRALLKARPEVTCWSSFLDQVEANRRARTTTGTGAVPVRPLAPVLPMRPSHRTAVAAVAPTTAAPAAAASVARPATEAA